MSYIAGPFDATWDDGTGHTSLGKVGNRGFEVEWFLNKELITTDLFGLSPVDAVYQGAELFIGFDLQEFNNDNLEDFIWPQSTTFGTDAVPGMLDSTFIGELVLEAVSGPNANIAGEDTYTFPRCVLAAGFPVRVAKRSRLKVIPIRLRVYPNETTRVFFTRS